MSLTSEIVIRLAVVTGTVVLVTAILLYVTMRVYSPVRSMLDSAHRSRRRKREEEQVSELDDVDTEGTTLIGKMAHGNID